MFCRGVIHRLVALRHEAGEKNYTAMDALPELLTNTPQTAQEKEAAQCFAQAVETQKEAVRRQYEGTAMWMKAPNGQPTNLTEEQWLAVRTPAFKAWFGNWEAARTLQALENLRPIKVNINKQTLDKKALKEEFEKYSGVKHDEIGITLYFAKGIAGKIIRHKGFPVASIIDSLFLSRLYGGTQSDCQSRA